MEREKVLLVFISFEDFKKNIGNENFHQKNTDKNTEELKNLTMSAGADVKEALCFKQKKPNPRYFINTGKLEKIKHIVKSSKINLVIFDEEITPTQQRNLQSSLDIKVLDRTALILDIFSQRAHSREGKIQVELAQLNYMLPRLTGKGIVLSRLGGGIGTRGPGETKLEADRRKIRRRISLLEKKIKQIGTQRNTQRKKREEKEIFQIALVGYTNSGKSTLLNAVTESDVYVEDRLFSTLDSTTRKLNVFPNSEVLISDTVGFIEKLPHQLIAAFRSTLEEVKKSNLLLLIVDISNPYFEKNINSVKEVLKEIEVDKKPMILVFNKIDKINKEKSERIKIKYKNSLFISALKKDRLSELYDGVKNIIRKQYINITVKIPYDENRVVSFIYKNCQVLKKRNFEDCTIMDLIMNSKYCPVLSKYIYRGGQG